MTPNLRALLSAESPLLLPVAHDALCAKLIERAGFCAYSMGGFALAALRYGLADVGVLSFGEIVAAVRDIMAASALPIVIDGDDGYGDAKNVTRMVRTYEAMGVAAIALEDQVSPKRCGHMAGKSVVPLDVATRKLEAALSARKNSNLLIIARTDARAVLGLDEAIARARHYAKVGADVVFVEAPQSLEELRRIGGSIECLQLCNMAEGGRTPIVSPADLKSMGFSMVVYPATLLLRVIKAITEALQDLRDDHLKLPDGVLSFQALTELLGLDEWRQIDERFGERDGNDGSAVMSSNS